LNACPHAPVFSCEIRWRAIQAGHHRILISLFLATVFGYGIAVWAAQRLPEPAFSGLNEPSIGKACLLSVSTLATAPLPNVAPETWVGQLIYGTELISTFLIVSVFIAMFGATMGVRWAEQQRELADTCASVQEWISGHHRRLTDELRQLASSQQGPVVLLPNPVDPPGQETSPVDDSDHCM